MTTEKPYTIKYKLPGQIFWRRVKGVMAETTVSEHGHHLGHLFCQLEGGASFCIPLEAEIKLPRQRNLNIVARREKQTGTQIKARV